MNIFTKHFNKKNLFFIAIFTILGFLALQVPFTRIMGSKINFTIFDFFSPIASAFIGLVPGLIAVFLMQLANFFLHGASLVDTATIIRFFPALFAVIYFGNKGKSILLIPIVAIIAFNLHPIGRTVWFYSAYWLIPTFCYFFRDRFILARSLGATFTAHAVGSTLWLYVFNLPASIWLALIPIVAIERSLFAVGIAATYMLMNNVLNWLARLNIIKLTFIIDRRYLWPRPIK